MGEALGNIQNHAVFSGENPTGPLTKRGRAHTKIHVDIEYLPVNDSNELGLSPWRGLVVQPAQHTMGRAGMIVLKKDAMDPRILERRSTVGFREEAPMITMPIRRDPDDVRDCERLEMKGHGTVGWMRQWY